MGDIVVFLPLLRGEMPGYADKASWDARYRENSDLFEWYAPYEYIKDRLTAATGVNEASKVLILGCGTSGLSAALFDSGVKKISSIDYSQTAVTLQTDRNKERKGMVFQVEDCRQLSFGKESFDVIIAKATIDAILCSDGANANIKATLKEVARVLKPGGTFVTYSHSNDEERLTYLDKAEYNWTITSSQFVRPSVTEVEGLPDDNPDNLLYEYVMKKN